jgi:toxin ParE1/3/4
MPAFRLTAKAKADLRHIGRYTQETWGQDQRNHYLPRLDEAFQLIFYCQSGTDIEIIRVLHERMALQARLAERSTMNSLLNTLPGGNYSDSKIVAKQGLFSLSSIP